MAKAKKSKLPIIILLTLLIVGLGLYGYSVVPKSTPIAINQISNSTGDVSLSLSPSTISGTLNTESSLTLSATTGSVKLMVLTIELSYDPAKISTPTVVQGSFLGNTLASPKVENGKITFTYAATPESGGSSGTGEVAIIKFKPTATGSSALTFTTGSIATAVKGTERIAGNSIKSAVDATITVSSAKTSDSSSATNPPTPTPTPSAAKNDVAAVMTTPIPTVKPTVKPKSLAVAPTTTQPTSDQSVTPVQNSNYSTSSDTMNTEEDLLVSEEDPIGTVTDTTTPKPPSFFKKLALGWGIIFQSILNLFR